MCSSPGPETECLVEAALERYPLDEPLRVLELGTGSGSISIALAHERPQWRILAVDISPDALEIARFNARRILQDHTITFAVGNWFEAIDGHREGFDLIISNPPYVARDDLAGLEPEVRQYEPGTALDGGVDGLESLNYIVCTAPRFLKPGALLILEIGCDQAKAVESIGRSHGAYRSVVVRKDYSGLDRVVMFQ